ncbi:MAG: cation transporter [Proteobacteria bacterium]|nr:cation transporter [Pseudomonadota bacterium]
MTHHPHHANEKRILKALLLTGIFMLVEVAGGLYAGSLALLADAGHMLTDTAALALAYGAFRLSRRPADQMRTYGYDRFQVLAAFINGLVLFGIFVWIVKEAIERIMAPSDVLAIPMLVVATAGLIINLISFKILHPGSKENLNIKGALLHVAFDILGSIGAIIAAVVIYFTGWMKIDPILSIFLAAMILPSAWSLVKKATHILMEGTPDSFNVEALKKDLVSHIPGLKDIHHVHVWLLTAERPLLSMHATVGDIKKSEKILLGIKKRLIDEHGINHSTVQIETEACADH